MGVNHRADAERAKANGTLDENTLCRLRAALEIGDPSNDLYMALLALGAAMDTSALELVRKYVSWKSDDVAHSAAEIRELAVFILGRQWLRAELLPEIVIAAASDEDPAVRDGAVRAIGELGASCNESRKIAATAILELYSHPPHFEDDIDLQFFYRSIYDAILALQGVDARCRPIWTSDAPFSNSLITPTLIDAVRQFATDTVVGS